jgi:predicted RNA-binding Zn ribbon-like protein
MEALCLDMINSDWRGYRGGEPEQDRLVEREWLEQTTRRWGIVAPHSSDVTRPLQELRTAMRRIIQAHNEEQEPANQDLEVVNCYLALMPATERLVRRSAGYVLEPVPLQQDWRWLLREVATSFVDMLTYYDPTRLKRCQNPVCGWAYYDESRQKNRCWCSEACSNLMRVRRFRAQRQKTPVQG